MTDLLAWVILGVMVLLALPVLLEITLLLVGLIYFFVKLALLPFILIYVWIKEKRRG